MSELTALEGTLDHAWKLLEDGAQGSGAARFVVLATSGPAGAEARMVVLRGAHRAEDRLSVFTDSLSEKANQIAHARQGGTVLVWDPEARFQIRIRAFFHLNDGAKSDWDALPDSARFVYGGTPYPGTAIDQPSAHTPRAEFDRFSEVVIHIDEIETLHLGRERHRRALFRRADAYRGVWLAP